MCISPERSWSCDARQAWRCPHLVFISFPSLHQCICLIGWPLSPCAVHLCLMSSLFWSPDAEFSSTHTSQSCLRLSVLPRPNPSISQSTAFLSVLHKCSVLSASVSPTTSARSRRPSFSTSPSSCQHNVKLSCFCSQLFALYTGASLTFPHFPLLSQSSLWNLSTDICRRRWNLTTSDLRQIANLLF